MGKTYLRVYAPDGTEVSRAITLANGKASLMWSQYEIHHGGARIGWLESGCPMDFVGGYRAEVSDEPPPEPVDVGEMG